MIRKNVHLSEVQIKQLKDLQEKTGISTAEHIRRAVDEYLESKAGDKND